MNRLVGGDDHPLIEHVGLADFHTIRVNPRARPKRSPPWSSAIAAVGSRRLQYAAIDDNRLAGAEAVFIRYR